MQRIYRVAVQIAHIAAVAGGIVLCLVILMTCASILGRAVNSGLHWIADFPGLSAPANAILDLGIGAIRGDFELVEVGLAFCIFAFLPLCQLTAAHATVDLIDGILSKPMARWFALGIEILFALSLFIIAYQLKLGLESKLRSGQTSLLLQFPVWWGYAGALIGATLSALAAMVMVGVRTVELSAGRSLIDYAGGADH